MNSFVRRAAGLCAALMLASFGASAAETLVPKEGTWTAPSFRFHTGEVLPNLHFHYFTLGNPSGQPVLVLHGTGQSAEAMLTPGYAGELFGSGQPLDAKTHYIIIPDALGTGKSSKPSDGLRTKFPRYNYDDMVLAQYRLLTEGLNIRHLRLVTGNSMGGMETWVWGVTYPDFMDALVPMASQPTEMSARNWMTRRIMLETIRRDPAYMNGDYKTQPASLTLASVFFGIATSGGTLGYQSLAPTREKADALVDQRLAAPPPSDANDFVYQFDASRDYNPSTGLERIKAPVLVINSADDERNPPETGVMAAALKRISDARIYLIPASKDTRGHGTTIFAKFWKQKLAEFLDGL
jgi:homoserine O-acetyltransferase